MSLEVECEVSTVSDFECFFMSVSSSGVGPVFYEVRSQRRRLQGTFRAHFMLTSADSKLA